MPLTGGTLRARLFIDDNTTPTLVHSVLSTAGAYPSGNGNVFIGTRTSTQPFNVDISWINITFRGIGSDKMLGI